MPTPGARGETAGGTRAEGARAARRADEKGDGHRGCQGGGGQAGARERGQGVDHRQEHAQSRRGPAARFEDEESDGEP